MEPIFNHLNLFKSTICFILLASQSKQKAKRNPRHLIIIRFLKLFYNLLFDFSNLKIFIFYAFFLNSCNLMSKFNHLKNFFHFLVFRDLNHLIFLNFFNLMSKFYYMKNFFHLFVFRDLNHLIDNYTLSSFPNLLIG